MDPEGGPTLENHKLPYVSLEILHGTLKYVDHR